MVVFWVGTPCGLQVHLHCREYLKSHKLITLCLCRLRVHVFALFLLQVANKGTFIFYENSDNFVP
jgi:hypothetical protein